VIRADDIVIFHIAERQLGRAMQTSTLDGVGCSLLIPPEYDGLVEQPETEGLPGDRCALRHAVPEPP
jgi:hypothetical protein